MIPIIKRTNFEIKELNSNLINPLSNLELGILLNEGSTTLGGLYV